MGVIKFDIRHPNGQRESAVVEGERALVGSASYSDVRLPGDQAAYEHVLIELHGGTLRAEAKAEKPPATINGMPLTASPLAPGAVLGVGAVKLYVEFVPDAADGPAITAKNKNESNPMIRIVALLLLAVAGYFVLFEDEPELEPAPAGAPELFSKAPVACPEKTPEQALALAKDKQDQAEGKRERLPFAASEGVAAVGLYRTASACFRAAAAEPPARDADENAASLEKTLVDEFRARRLRLTHMLTVQDYELVLRDVSVLLDMCQGKKGAYVTWLLTVKKRMKAKGL